MGLTRDEAVALCERVRRENGGKLLSVARMQCWGCMRWGGEPEKRCMHDEETGGWDACAWVNELAARNAGDEDGRS